MTAIPAIKEAPYTRYEAGNERTFNTKAIKRVDLPLNDADTAGGVAAVELSATKNCVVIAKAINVTTIATGACTVDVGVAANATTSNDTLFDGLDVHTAGGKVALGTNGLPEVAVDAGKFVTASKASGAAAGLEGTLTLVYIELP